GHDVGTQALHQGQRFQAICGLAHHVDLGIPPEDLRDEEARGRRVVDDQDAGALHRSCPTASNRPLRSKPLFTMYASAPASSPRARSLSLPSDVTSTTGIRRSACACRSVSVSVTPSMPGISTSAIT